MNKVNFDLHTFTSAEKLELLQQKYNLPQQLVTSLLDRAEIAHLNFLDDSFYFLLKFPHKPFESGNHVTRSLAIYVTDNKLYFIVHKDIPMKKFIHSLHQDYNQSQIITAFFLYMLQTFETILSNTEEEIMEKEKKLFKSPKNETIEQLLHIQKVMIHFKVALVGFKNILQTISQQNHRKFGMNM